MLEINEILKVIMAVIIVWACGSFADALYNEWKKKKVTGGAHRWSGWPGAFCLYCGAEDLLEIAVGNGYFNPYTGKWDSRKHKREYTNKPCPFVPPEVDPYSLPYPLPNNWEYMV